MVTRVFDRRRRALYICHCKEIYVKLVFPVKQSGYASNSYLSGGFGLNYCISLGMSPQSIVQSSHLHNAKSFLNLDVESLINGTYIVTQN
jgi:hypothetical protein